MAKKKEDPEIAATRIAAEKREADEMVASIMQMTSRVPNKIINGASINLTRQYKDAVTKARSAAGLKIRSLSKLRQAYINVCQFYN